MAELWLNVTLDATDVQTNGGAPTVLFELQVRPARLSPAPLSPSTLTRVSRQWFNKTATRLAEAAWVQFPLHVAAEAVQDARG